MGPLEARGMSPVEIAPLLEQSGEADTACSACAVTSPRSLKGGWGAIIVSVVVVVALVGVGLAATGGGAAAASALQRSMRGTHPEGRRKNVNKDAGLVQQTLVVEKAPPSSSTTTATSTITSTITSTTSRTEVVADEEPSDEEVLAPSNDAPNVKTVPAYAATALTWEADQKKVSAALAPTSTTTATSTATVTATTTATDTATTTVTATSTTATATTTTATITTSTVTGTTTTETTTTLTTTSVTATSSTTTSSSATTTSSTETSTQTSTTTSVTQTSTSSSTSSSSTTSRTTTVTTSTITTTSTLPRPTLFCWSHMEPGSSEEALLKMQLRERISIFSCTYTAVISTEALKIGELDGTAVVTWANPAPTAITGTRGVNGSTTDSYLNTRTFIAAWDIMMNSGHLWAYDFVVKVDPDAVFFPERLKMHVLDHIGESVYIPNCGKYGGDPLLYGSLEVFSVEAIKKYHKNPETCKGLPWRGWGEDYYMQHCMEALGVKAVLDPLEVGDDRCLAAPCTDYTKVAFHAFKTVPGWTVCYKEAIGKIHIRTDLVP